MDSVLNRLEREIKEGGNKDADVVKQAVNALNDRLRTLNENEGDRQPDEDELYERARDAIALRNTGEAVLRSKAMTTHTNGAVNHKDEIVYAFIHSGMRNPKRYPNAGDFTIKLSREINNIVKAELVQASIPLVDPTVHADNNTLRYSLSPFTTVNEVTVPVGSYKGDELAIELTRQFNYDRFSADILANNYVIDDQTGHVLDPATGLPPATTVQFDITWNEAQRKMFFKLVDDDLLPVNSPAFALHIKPSPADFTGELQQTENRDRTDDLADVLGIDRREFKKAAAVLSQYDAASGTYYLRNTDSATLFNGDGGTANSVDPRTRYTIHSSEAADLRGNMAAVLDIRQLNDNSLVQPIDTFGTGALNVGGFFGTVMLQDPATVTSRSTDITNNSFPVRKEYPEGRSRISTLDVTVRRPDGSVFDFGGSDIYLVIRLTVKRPRPTERPVFGR
jgi:hypothetical protein